MKKKKVNVTQAVDGLRANGASHGSGGLTPLGTSC
jgi:hypothetical protein